MLAHAYFSWEIEQKYKFYMFVTLIQIYFKKQISFFNEGKHYDDSLTISFFQYYKSNLKREYGTDEWEQGHGKQTVAEHWRGARERDRFVG